jgi:hypothetical protein
MGSKAGELLESHTTFSNIVVQLNDTTSNSRSSTCIMTNVSKTNQIGWGRKWQCNITAYGSKYIVGYYDDIWL